MASLHSITIGEDIEFKRRLAYAGFTAEMVRAVNGDVFLAEVMYEALAQRLRVRFTEPEKQVERVRGLNLVLNWGISNEAFEVARQNIPARPEKELVAVTLVPYLKDKNGIGGIERTFQSLWDIVESPPEGKWRWEGYEKAGSERLRLLEGIEHPATREGRSCLRWEVIDLDCNCANCPLIRRPETSPHAGILACAVLHPEWVKAMDRKRVSDVWIPGYEVNMPGYEPWSGVPDLCRLKSGKLGLGADRSDHWYPDSAVPEFYRE